MKPDTKTAMHDLIRMIRSKMPFEMPEAQACSGICNGCSQKLLEYLDTELISWEQRLDEGDTPNLGDIKRLAKSSLKIYRVLHKNKLVPKLDLNTTETHIS
ncbi:MAG: hypothetical protein OQL09_06455 [Gammaproteobacteria bacterium]|nr:hypothetical protein [Gammaproteobacteria bacterium]